MNRLSGIWATAILATAGGLAAFGAGVPQASFAAEQAVRIAPAAYDPADQRASATAILAGGCFWGVEGVFSHVKGIKSVVSGYHGGSKATATYDRTNRGDTGHAEAVRIVYDPRVVSYGELLRVYFSVVTDPTQLNRQGPDRGSQYRSAIVPTNAAQAKVAQRYIAQLGKGGYYSKPIVTRIESNKGFYRAEAYHQDFMADNPRHGYIVRWDAPKLANLKALFPALYTAKTAP